MMDLPLEDLIEAGEQDDAETRRAAAYGLGTHLSAGDRRAIPPLLRLLEDSGRYVDEAASDALQRGGELVVEPLIALLNDRAADAHARGWAARTLGHIGDKWALDAMIAVLSLRSAPSEVRQMVAFYLGRLGDRGAVMPLVRAMVDRTESLEVRRNATRALAELGDSDAFEPLMEMLHDEQIGNVAASALEEMRDPRAISLLPTFASDDASLRLRAAAIVGKLGNLVVESLLASLESDDWRVRSAAAAALRFAEDRRVVTPLIAALQHDPNEVVRADAAGALGFLEDERILHVLIDALEHDESVRVRQVSGLGLFHRAISGQLDAGILPTLQQIAAHDTGTVRGILVVRSIVQRTIEAIIARKTRPASPD